MEKLKNGTPGYLFCPFTIFNLYIYNVKFQNSNNKKT